MSENLQLLKWFGVGLLFFAFMVSIFMIYGGHSTRVKVENQYMEAYRAPSSLSSTTMNLENSLVNQVRSSYQNEDYSKGIQWLQVQIEDKNLTDKQVDTINNLLGHFHVRTMQLDEARKYFKKSKLEDSKKNTAKLSLR